jgi:hypothetical protein
MATSNDQGPSYYKRGTIEVWTFIRDQQLNFHLGNAIKYICRAGYKDNKQEDLKKAIHYLQNELDNETNAWGAGNRVPSRLQTTQRTECQWPDYAEDFDR